MQLKKGFKIMQLEKRLFDLIFSIIGLFLTFWVIIIAWLISSFETRSNGFFIQKRVGKDGKIFNVIKIKTMKKINGINSTITSSNDIRITKSGKFFRNTKIDELPQLWNVLIGDMSFVGPRPDVPGYADKLEGDARRVLELKPGITGPASLKYSNEEYLLSLQANPQRYNDEVIFPDKVRINLHYLKHRSFAYDLKLIIYTILGKNIKENE